MRLGHSVIKKENCLRLSHNTTDNPFILENFLFKEQLKFVLDPSPFKTAVCSRRSGKTVSCAADLINTAVKFNGINCLYITLSRNNAKKIIWKDLIKINEQHKLRGRIDSTELSITFPNNSVIYLSGAKDKTEIEKFRGLSIKKCYIDESQAFRSYIEQLIDDIITPALMDYAGSLCLIGTPGPIPSGYFYQCSELNKEWSHHEWTFWNNPHIVEKSKMSHQSLLNRELKRRGIGTDHPSIQREWFGKWVLDSDALLIHYNESVNHFEELLPAKYHFIMGIDIGFHDADAIAIIAWSEADPVTYLVEEMINTKQGLTELVEQINGLQLKYDCDKLVIDTGGLGKKLAEEMIRRHSIPVEAADKTRKMESIEFLNDALRSSRFKAKKDSRFAQDTYLIEVDREKSTPDKVIVSSKYHSDICFVAGTLITMSEGTKKIEDVCVEDKVLTRYGVKNVIASGLTCNNAEIIELEFSNGSIIRCTHAHPFFTIERGFIRADALSYGDSFVAKNFLSQTNTPKSDSAVKLVRRSHVLDSAPVYNLTVEDKHEYFANEILVSNCDAVIYAFKESPSFSYEAPIIKLPYGTKEWLDQEAERMEVEAEEYFTKMEEDVKGEEWA